MVIDEKLVVNRIMNAYDKGLVVEVREKDSEDAWVTLGQDPRDFENLEYRLETEIFIMLNVGDEFTFNGEKYIKAKNLVDDEFPVIIEGERKGESDQFFDSYTEVTKVTEEDNE